MEPRIELLEEKRLVGMHLKMSLTENRTGELWRSFMPRRREIGTIKNNNLYSIQVYPEAFSPEKEPEREFEKWATVETDGADQIPEGMELFCLPGGLYAVFEYKGMSNDDSIFRYIYGKWLPESGYEADDRPQFELLGEKYKNMDPESEEEIWIAIKERAGGIEQ